MYTTFKNRPLPMFPLLNNIINETVHRPMADVQKWSQPVLSYPKANVVEDENGFVIHLTVPGMQKKDIEIVLEENKLTVSTNKAADDDNRYTKREFNYGSFSRRFFLPNNIDVAKITAAVKDGILSINLPKAEAAKPKTITIK